MELDKRILNETYFNPINAGSLSGLYQFYKQIKKKNPNITYNQIKNWL